MFQEQAIFKLIISFILLSAMVCVAGIFVTKSVVKLSKEISFGDMIGGLVFLAIITNLPEIAITAAAAKRGELDLAISNILGGIALQTVVICLFDIFRPNKSRPFTYESSSNQVILSSLLVIFVLTLVILGYYISPEISFGGIPFPELLIVMSWFFSLVVIQHDKTLHKKSGRTQNLLTRIRLIEKKNFVIFLISVVGTLVGGFYLERVSYKLASAWGMTGTLFGATILAFITALPEISTGLEAILLKHNRLAVTDIFGGNAFLPCLFLPAAIYLGQGTLPMAQKQDMYLTALGILLTTIYAGGLTIKAKREFLRLGYDTWAVLIFYTLGVLGLVLF